MTYVSLFPHYLILPFLRTITPRPYVLVCIPKSQVALDTVQTELGEGFVENYRWSLCPAIHLNGDHRRNHLFFLVLNPFCCSVT